MGKAKTKTKTKTEKARSRPRKVVHNDPSVVAAKLTAGKKKKRDRPREIDLELLQIRVADGEMPDGLHELALEEFQKNRITLEELNELLALHSRPAVVSIPTMDDETYDAELKEMVNDDA